MVVKVLVIEDMDMLYELMLRKFEKALSINNFEFTNVKTIPFALDSLEQDWDAILVDYYLGVQHGVRGESCFRNGADLVTYRRALEKAEPEKKKAHIIGFSGSDLCNSDMLDAGATCTFLKLNALGIAGSLDGLEK